MHFPKTDIPYLSRDGVWRNVKNLFSPYVRELFPLHDDMQVTAHLSSLVNFAPFIEPLFNTLAPTHICEIGSLAQVTTTYLYRLAGNFDAKLDCVDPTVNVQQCQKNFPGIHCFPMKSQEYFAASPEVANIYMIDGDHNYDVLFMELNAVDSLSANSDKAVCMFLHDTGWPWAVYDGFYQPDEARRADEIIKEKCLSLFTDIPVEDGMYFRNLGIIPKKDNDKVGTRTALMDFLRTSCRSWKHVFIPSIFGCSVVWLEDNLDEAQKVEFAKLSAIIEQLSPFLSLLELNRLFLCQNYSIATEVQMKIREADSKSLWRKLTRSLGKMLGKS